MMSFKLSESQRATIEGFERNYLNAKDEYGKFQVLKRMAEHIKVLYEIDYLKRTSKSQPQGMENNHRNGL